MSNLKNHVSAPHSQTPAPLVNSIDNNGSVFNREDYLDVLEGKGRIESEGDQNRSFRPWRLMNAFSYGHPKQSPYLFSEGLGAPVWPYDVRAIRRQIFHSRRVQKAIAAHVAKSQGKATLKYTARIVKKMLRKLCADFTSDDTPYLNAYHKMNVVLSSFYQGVHVHKNDFAHLAKTARLATENGCPLIFVPCHKSHIDYLVLNYANFRLGISPCHIAAGDNLNMPLVGNMLRSCGAFFIRRKFVDDELYTNVVREYISVILENNFNLQFFIEGTRSRTGKLAVPKLGMLRMVLEDVLDGRIQDAYLCPVSITYDKVMETNSYISELLGSVKTKENLVGLAAQTIKLVNPRSFGRINIRFAPPLTVKQYALRRMQEYKSFNPYQCLSQRPELTRNVAYRILDCINQRSAITGTCLVATVLLATRGRGIGRKEMIERVAWLRNEIIGNGVQVTVDKSDDIPAAVDRAIQALRNNIYVYNYLLEPVYKCAKRFELSYYRNACVHVFVRQSLLAIALLGYSRQHPNERTVHPDALLEDLEFISGVLKLEFVFPEAKTKTRPIYESTLKANMYDTLNTMQERELIKMQGDDLLLVHVNNSEWDDNFSFLCMLLYPFIESYWLASVGLFMLLPQGPMENKISLMTNKEFLKRLLLLANTMFQMGHLSYHESISQESLKHALMTFSKSGIIITRKVTGPFGVKTSMIALTSSFLDESKLRRFCERLSMFRRAGLYRKKADSEHDRVIRLARL